MKKSIKILIGIGISIIIIFLVITLFIYMKKKRDINDMKKGTSEFLQASGIDKNKADKIADCYIDKLISDFGWLKTKDIYNSDVTPSESDSKKMANYLAECS